MTTVLVTGGAGAIGSHLSKRLLDEGFSVVVLDDLSSGRQQLIPEGVTFVRGSICDEADLEKAFTFEPKYVFHLAALFANQQSIDRPVADITTNGIGTINLLTWSSRVAVEKFLYTSSSCIYGSRQEVMSEQDAGGELDTPYAATKLLSEHYTKMWTHNYSIPSVVLRLFNSYGPAEYPGKYRNVIPNFLSLALSGKPLPIFGTGQETRDFTFVSDVVDGIILALKTETGTNGVFNIGTGNGVSVLSLAEKINEMTNNSGGVAFQDRRSWDQVSHRRADIARARKELGYSPKVTLEDGLARTMEWFNKYNVR